MTQDIKELRDQIAHHETMAAHHTHLATSLRIQYETLSGGPNVDWGNGLLKKRPTKSHGRWQAYLKAHGPATRQTIAKSVGLLTGDTPPYADSLGLSTVELVEASYPDDFLLRLSIENPQGKGRPVDVYFLWSQRFDVKPLYGVGPEKLTEETLLGVIHPPEQEFATGGVVSREAMEEIGRSITDGGCTLVLPTVPEPEPLTAATWIETHSDIFDLVKMGVKPDAEQRLLLRADAPEGVDANIAIMLAAQGRLNELPGLTP